MSRTEDSTKGDSDWGSYLTSRGGRSRGQKAGNAASRRRSWTGGAAAQHQDPTPSPGMLLPSIAELRGSNSSSPQQQDSPDLRAGFPDMSGPNHAAQARPGVWVDFKPSPSSTVGDHLGSSGGMSPADAWAEDLNLWRRGSSGGQRDSADRLRRVSCDSYDYDALEASRMRIKQAAWEVVNAQQKIDQQVIAPPASLSFEREPKPKRSWAIRKWFSSKV